jgi:RNA polymerase sigma factor (sigma-70 family)
MPEKTDSELVELARNGDKEAFGKLISRYQEVARRFAMRLVQNEDCAQDLAQESAFQAYRSIGNLRDATRFRSWLYGIVWNVCQSYIRDQSAARKAVVEEATENNRVKVPRLAITTDDIEKQEEHQTVLEAIDSLSPLYKEIIILFYFQQLKISEIAGQLAITEATVRVRLNRARKQLRTQLLRLNPEILSERGGTKMIKVNIADITRQEMPDEDGYAVMHYILVLKEEKGRRAMLIWIGPTEGSAITMGLGKFAAKRPMTFSFFANLLKSIDANIEQVQVVALKDDTFFGTVKVHCGATTVEVDARPSDAIALAVTTGSPIFVAEEVMDKAGVEVTGPVDELKIRSGMEDILNDVRKSYKHYTKVPFRERSREEIVQISKKIVDSVFNKQQN